MTEDQKLRRKIYHARWYKAHREEQLLATAEWAKKNPEKRKEICARYQRTHKAEDAARMRAWRKANPDKARNIDARSRNRHKAKRNAHSSKYAREHRNEINAKQLVRTLKKYHSDPLFRTIHLIRSRIRIGIKKAKKDAHKADKTINLLGCSFNELLAHVEKQFAPGMTREHFMRGELHLDHIKPCAAFDLSDPEQQRICFHYTNLQPLWAKDNLAKGAKYFGP